MIPKTIHYCWFGDKEESPFIKNCVKTWKENMSDYSIRRWSDKDLDLFEPSLFLTEAYNAKKWAFVADYARFQILSKEGGIYFDADTKVLKTFEDEWLLNDFLGGIEYHPVIFKDYKGKLNSLFQPIVKNERINGLGLNCGVFASTPNHPFINSCIEKYRNLHFISENGVIDIGNLVIGGIVSKVAEDYGFVYQDKKQILKNNMLIFPSNIFVGNTIFLDKSSYNVQMNNGSWVKKNKYDTFLYNIRNNHPIVYPIFRFIDKCKNKFKRIVLK